MRKTDVKIIHVPDKEAYLRLEAAGQLIPDAIYIIGGGIGYDDLDEDIRKTIDGAVQKPEEIIRGDLLMFGYRGALDYSGIRAVDVYSKPTGGIPEDDLAEEVKKKLNSGGGTHQVVDSKIIDVTTRGVNTTNTGYENSSALQALIDESVGILFFPPGEYSFAKTLNVGTGECCIKLKSGTAIIGSGASSILKIVGSNADGINLFHFNELADTGNPTYLENCVFRDFVVDGSEQHCTNYTSAGKAFMINLMKNCHWDNVHVRNIDATGFGMDCPIDCSMSNCTAENCGKATDDVNAFGASGIGIGFGYSEDECMTISNCICNNNRHFGIFFEHQGRFSSGKYNAMVNRGFTISNCVASGNGYNFGAILGVYVQFTGCHSMSAVRHGFYLDTCNNSGVKACHHSGQGEAGGGGFAVYASTGHGNWRTNDIVIQSNSCKYARRGFIVNSDTGITTDNTRIVLSDNVALACTETDFAVSGKWGIVDISGNVSTANNVSIDNSQITTLDNRNNDWNSSITNDHINSLIDAKLTPLESLADAILEVI